MKTYRVTAYNAQYKAYRCTSLNEFPLREVFVDFDLYNPGLRAIKLVGKNVTVQEEIPFCVIACGAQIVETPPAATEQTTDT